MRHKARPGLYVGAASSWSIRCLRLYNRLEVGPKSPHSTPIALRVLNQVLTAMCTLHDCRAARSLSTMLSGAPSLGTLPESSRRPSIRSRLLVRHILAR